MSHRLKYANIAEKQKAYRWRLKLERPLVYKERKEKDAKSKREKWRKTKGIAKLLMKQHHADIAKRSRVGKMHAHGNLPLTHPYPNQDSYAPYKTKQSLAKATKKALHGLPRSPRKRNAVLAHLGVKFRSLSSLEEAFSNSAAGNKKLSAQVESNIEDFFRRDDISWQAPGRKDFISLPSDVGKIHLQKRFLLLSLKECHHAFLEEYPDCRVSLSKFCVLRPPNVLLQQELPHNVCVCKYHENVRLLLLALCPLIPGFPQNFRQLISLAVCDDQQEACMFGQCASCRDNFLDNFGLDDTVGGSFITWEQWGTECSQVCKLLKAGTVYECYDSLKEQLPYFLMHTFVKRKQTVAFMQSKSNASPKHAVVQVDFAENMTLIDQNEIQARHWHHKQVTIFTCYVWAGNGNNYALVLVSDDLNHEFSRSLTLFFTASEGPFWKCKQLRYSVMAVLANLSRATIWSA